MKEMHAQTQLTALTCEFYGRWHAILTVRWRAEAISKRLFELSRDPGIWRRPTMNRLQMFAYSPSWEKSSTSNVMEWETDKTKICIFGNSFYVPLGSEGFLVEKAHPSAVLICFHMLSTDSLRLIPSCLRHFKHIQKRIHLDSCVKIKHFQICMGNFFKTYFRNIWKWAGRTKFILSLSFEIVSLSNLIKAHACSGRVRDTWGSLVRRNEWYLRVGAGAFLVFRSEGVQRLEEACHIAELILRLGTKGWAGLR